MGFLKFLKREKKRDEFDELDLPPAPPPLEGFEEDMPKLPDFPELPDFGLEEAGGKEEWPEFEFPEKEEKAPTREEAEMPEFPTSPIPPETAEKPLPPISSQNIPGPSAPAPITSQATEEAAQEGLTPQDVYPKIERRLFSQEKRILRERPSGRMIYVRVDRFKATLGSISMVRSDLRKSEEALMKLEGIKNAKDKSFDKIKSSLDDLQKKLIFIDRTLFKGE